MMIRWLLPFLYASAVSATSVAPELHECPVCGVKSVTISFQSYSQFGEPARDLSDTPMFAFADVDICPRDLYASWSSDWSKIQPVEKAKLVSFLKQPKLRLTDKEKVIISGHEAEFRESDWFLPLWARSCDELRDLDETARLNRQLWLNHLGRFTSGEDTADWEKELASLYRENAISALKVATSAERAAPTSKRVFAYLHAEFTRQAGRKEEALTLFREVITAEKTAKPDEDFEWISRWAEEQILLCSSDGNSQSMANKSKEKLKHHEAELARKNRDKSWRKNVLLPAVRKAVIKGGLPEVEMPEDEDSFGIFLLPDDEPDGAPKKVYKKLDRELYELWQEQPPTARADIARIYIRMLSDYEETWESTHYPASDFLPEIADTAEGRIAIAQELNGDWKSSFWKVTCAYAARIPDSGVTFIQHPFTVKADNSLVVKLLIQHSDASWMPRAIEMLNKHEWVSDEIIEYLVFLNLPEASSALDQAADDIRKEVGNREIRNPIDGKLNTLRDLDEVQIKKSFAKLPFMN